MNISTPLQASVVVPREMDPVPSGRRLLGPDGSDEHDGAMRLSRTISLSVPHLFGTAVAQWLRCCATNRKVLGSVPASDIGIFHSYKILPIALCPWGTGIISWG